MAVSKYAEIIKNQIKNFDQVVKPQETGTVLRVGDGIVETNGLDNIMLNEIVSFDNGSTGLAFNLEENSVGIVMLDTYTDIKQDAIAKRTKKLASVKVGDGLLGRVVDALGRPVDGLGDIKEDAIWPIEKIAPGVMTRQSINQPLETGILAVDSMFPVGKGQRELIIGDRQTGKTSIAIDAIINQKGKNVKCVYVAIGQKNSTIVSVTNNLKRHDALEYTTIVNAPASSLPALKYIAPFAGITIAEYWMSKGQDVLIVYDDLSKHAIAYRTLSLLLRRPPGREAYPGDIFYLHSRLLERSGKLNEKHGGGSITALPIVETQGGDISTYIPTNVISITDGQLFTMTSLFNSGQRPAIDAGLSVSRVGSAAQTKMIKKFSGSLKVELASFKELQAFSQFGSDLDKQTKATLDHGNRIMILMKQPRNAPLSLANEALILFAIWKKYIRLIPIEHIQDFKDKLIEYYKSHDIIDLINLDNPSEEVITKIDFSIKRYISTYLNNKDLLKQLSEEDCDIVNHWTRVKDKHDNKNEE